MNKVIVLLRIGVPIFALAFTSYIGCSPLLQCQTANDCAKGYVCDQGACKDPSKISPGQCPQSCASNQHCSVKACGTKTICHQGLCMSEATYHVNPNKVDILFVIDNSGSMGPIQDKVKVNIENFITTLAEQDINDFQIGVVTTDMSDLTHSGKLQGSPKIINAKTMSKPQIISTFTKNVGVGTLGTSYEKGLDAIRVATSSHMTKPGGPNAGFLRQNTPLAIFIVSDEDDCSNNGSFPETEYPSDVCYLPKSQNLRDPHTKDPIMDSQNKPIRGQLESLTPTSTYIKELKSLQRDIILSGVFGYPAVPLEGSSSLSPADTNCQKDSQCDIGTFKRFCSFSTPQVTVCGGCQDQGVKAKPAFRYDDLLKAFGGIRAPGAICGKEEAYKLTLQYFANRIKVATESITLSKPISNLLQIYVQIEKSGGKWSSVPRAKSTTKQCLKDKDCGESDGFICGPGNNCYGDGWVYFAPSSKKPQATIRLSGKYRKNPIGSSIRVLTP